MSERFELTGDRSAIRLNQSGLEIVAAGLSGYGEWFGGGEAKEVMSKSAALTAWDEAISETEFEDRHTILLDAHRKSSADLASKARAGDDAEYVSLSAPIADDEMAILMYQDENGGISFHAPVEAKDQVDLAPSDAPHNVIFKFDLRSAANDRGAKKGGLFGQIFTKIIKVIVVKVLPGLVGSVAESVVARWEDRNRGFQGLYAEGPDHWQSEPTQLFDRFDALAGNRSLLFIHGTFSTNARTFIDIAENGTLLNDLSALYQGRILGFNHQTLTASVAENVALFYQQFDGHPGVYEFDVVAHSRGGLVARAICDLSDEAMSEALGRPWRRPPGVDVRIRKVIFVATPNEGTVLAQPDGISSFVNLMASYANIFPGGLFSAIVGGVLALASGILEVTLPRLPGLVDQAPQSDLQAALQHTAERRANFYAFSADFEPSGDLATILADLAIDQIFDMAANDLVVPTKGVAEPLSIPETRLILHAADERVHHGAFFRAADFAESRAWLST